MKSGARIIVVGGSGRLGRSLVPELENRGYNLINIDRRESDLLPTRLLELERYDSLMIAFEELRVQSCDSIIHLAAIPSPRNSSEQEIIRNNVMATFNVMSAAAQFDVGNIVYASSEAVLGYAYATTKIVPQSLPIDESHPLLAQDAYGLSKILSEEICGCFARREPRLSVKCLRFAWIWWRENYQANSQRVKADPDYAASKLWAFVDEQDAVQACRIALERKDVGLACAFIASRQTFMEELTYDLVKQYWCSAGCKGAETIEKHDSIIDCSKAKKMWGFEDRYYDYRKMG